MYIFHLGNKIRLIDWENPSLRFQQNYDLIKIKISQCPVSDIMKKYQ